MEWHNSLSIGNQEIDSQHKKLVRLISRLQENIKDGSLDKGVGVVIKEVVAYTKEHFEDEELLMEGYHYPGLEQHRQLHHHLLEELKRILIQIKDGREINSIDLYEFLRKWLTDHIIAEDLKFGKFIKKVVEETSASPFQENEPDKKEAKPS